MVFKQEYMFDSLHQRWEITNGLQWLATTKTRLKYDDCIPNESQNKYFFLHFQMQQYRQLTSVPSVYTRSAKDKSISPRAGVTAFLWRAHKEFWLASHPDNGAEPVCTAGGDIGVVHSADSSSTTSLSGGLAHTQL